MTAKMGKFSRQSLSNAKFSNYIMGAVILGPTLFSSKKYYLV